MHSTAEQAAEILCFFEGYGLQPVRNNCSINTALEGLRAAILLRNDFFRSL
jgi:hypothetical protein